MSGEENINKNLVIKLLFIMSVTYRYVFNNINGEKHIIYWQNVFILSIHDVKYWRNRLFMILKKKCPQNNLFLIVFQSSWVENLLRLFVLMSHIILLVIMGDHTIVIRHAYCVIWKLVGATLQSKRLIHPEWDSLRQTIHLFLFLSKAADRFIIFSIRKHAAASCCYDGAQRWVIFSFSC